MITKSQNEQLKELEIDENTIELQIQNFKNGFPFTKLLKPATINDGLIKISPEDEERWISYYESQKSNFKALKFVPASGAATRMFKSLFEFLNRKDKSESIAAYPDVKLFIENLSRFAFYEDLQKVLNHKNLNLLSLIKQERYDDVILAVLESYGLNYKSLPKGLLKFHSYPEGSRTPVEEHLIEAFNYAANKNSVDLHFTVSPEHARAFDEEFKYLLQKYRSEININYSFQKKSTDTIAVDLNNEPVLEKERFVFRPGGHGALLNNLNDLDADIIFIKNIDNVVPDHLKEITYRYKKILAGILISALKQRNEIVDYLETHNFISEDKFHEFKRYLENVLHIDVPQEMNQQQLKFYIISALDRPIRVCGLVKNEGEPGGGPFWVMDKHGKASLQIVETSQIDPKDKVQQEILKQATHFNPVDLVCSTKDNNGKKYDLMKFRDPETGFITEKTINGTKVKAQELPGLWNGSMAHWLSIFVEVPIETFNPVKTINDLLRKEHQSNVPNVPEDVLRAY